MKANLTPVAVILGACIIGFCVYLGMKAGDQAGIAMVTAQPTRELTASPTIEITPTIAPTPTVSDTEIVEIIKTQLAKKYGQKPEGFVVAVSQVVDGKWAKGSVREKLEQAGGYWLAAKGTDWVLVYDGQSQPKCAEVDKYEFPVTLVTECLNGSKVIER